MTGQEREPLQITSLPQLGEDFGRTEGRAYFTSDETFVSYEKLHDKYRRFAEQARHEHSRRRVVFRVRCTPEVVHQVVTQNELPVEVILPLNMIDANTQDAMMTLGENVHHSEIPEWEGVYAYWQRTNGHGRTPLSQIERHNPATTFFTSELTLADTQRLTQIWEPFGWTQEGVEEFIQTYRGKKFFSGVVDRRTNQLVSACMAESTETSGITIIEGTEYGTFAGQEGNGYCTAAVVGLHAQLLRHFVYQREDARLPLILSEFNMTSRSDIVGRHTGMTIPLVENTPGLENTPIQVLRYNVSVQDRHAPNLLHPNQLGEDADQYRPAYAETYPYWRNFIVGILPETAIREHYSEEKVAQILSHFEQRD